ncbi:hypothetical protein CHS0354_033803 [Potamilus streckersoni]|uniref:Uncharacterized protein n=1 Tax=Potamilus streckersoni TaxID=2493646 RepID=A0AAE0SGC8_9BIVA|nr:hypothetical protein CHS0354_033803 [Potamilus streckersoni]
MADEKMIPKIVQQNVLDAALVLECRVSRTGNFLWQLNGSVIVNHYGYFENDTFLFMTKLILDDQYNLYQCADSGSGLASDLYKIKISAKYNA